MSNCFVLSSLCCRHNSSLSSIMRQKPGGDRNHSFLIFSIKMITSSFICSEKYTVRFCSALVNGLTPPVFLPAQSNRASVSEESLNPGSLKTQVQQLDHFRGNNPCSGAAPLNERWNNVGGKKKTRELRKAEFHTHTQCCRLPGVPQRLSSPASLLRSLVPELSIVPVVRLLQGLKKNKKKTASLKS